MSETVPEVKDIGQRLGFANKKHMFIELFLIIAVAVVLIYAVFYDIPQSLKPKVCLEAVIKNEANLRNVTCGYCKELEFNRTLTGSINTGPV